MNTATVRTAADTAPTSTFDAFDPFYSTWKRADALPEWLRLQHRIREALNRLMSLEGTAAADQDDQREAFITSINAAIAAYNESVPSIHLQKQAVHADRLEDAYEDWL